MSMSNTTTTSTTAFVTRDAYDTAVAAARAAAQAYYHDDTLLVDDATYDTLARRIAATEAAHPEWVSAETVTGKVAGGTTAAGATVTHSTPMLSLDNVYSPAEIVDWVAKAVAAAGTPAKATFTVEAKLDGLALAARYVDGRLATLVTRGDGTTGEDVTFAAAAIAGLPARLTDTVSVEVRGEVYMSAEDFAAANVLRTTHGDTPFVNARNGAAGSLRGAKDRSYTLPLHFAAYAVADHSVLGTTSHTGSLAHLAELGVATVTDVHPVTVCTDAAQVAAAVAAIGDARASLSCGIDGAVIKLDDHDHQRTAGLTSRAPRWAVAYKYPAEEKLTTLLEVIPQVGRTGVITPRARITPTEVGGVTIEFATLHNWELLTTRGYMLGDRCVVRRAGDVIPELLAPNVALRDPASVTPITVPSTCPRCEGTIDTSQARWRCTRGRLCGLAESVRYAVSRDALDIDGMGDTLVSQLVDRGLVSDLADLFTLTPAQLAGLDRMGATSATKVVEQITAARQAPVARVITALGIRGTGRSLSRRLAKQFGSLTGLAGADITALQGVDGIGTEKAALIREELDELAELIAKLTTLGMGAAETAGTATATATSGAGPLVGKTVCISGSVPGLTRTEAQELVESLGGKAAGSVSKTTDILVAGDGAGSKRTKADQLGVTIWEPEQLLALRG
jgi:DNA ligase (NAD+)